MFIVLETYSGCLPEVPVRTFPDRALAVDHLRYRMENARDYVENHVEGDDPTTVNHGDAAWVYLDRPALRSQDLFWSGRVVAIATVFSD